MTEALGKRKAETALWETYQPLLHFLFIVQDRTLKEVSDIMAKACGFVRKEHQYESRLRNWGYRKNFSEEEWRNAKSLTENRKLKGKPSTIESSGRIIKRAQKRADRHAYETTYERLRRQMSNPQSVSRSEQIALIPRTPSPVPIMEQEQVSKTLWFSCLNLLENTFTLTSQNQVGFVRQDPTISLCHAISRLSLQSQSKAVSEPWHFLGQRPLLRDRLLSSPCGSVINVDETIALRTGQALMDLIKSAIYLISNNIAEYTGIGPQIISICQLPTNRKMLEHLLKQKHPTIEAFAEGLLHYASEMNDADLVGVLIRHGVDPNSNCAVCGASIPYRGLTLPCRPRLLCAITSQSSEVAVTLLGVGADDKRLDHDGSSCLMKCYQSNLLPLASDLLQRGADVTIQSSPQDHIGPLPNAILNAVLYGGLPAVRTLAEHDPLVFRDMIHHNESAAFTMAASIGNEALVRFFLENGIDLGECGAGLCGAAWNGKIGTVKLLLAHGVNFEGRHRWIFQDRGSVWRTRERCTLETALEGSHLAVIRLLSETCAMADIRPSALNKLCSTMIIERGTMLEHNELASLVDSGKIAERIELVEHLLQAGAKHDDATLVWLSLAGAAGPVRRLIERGAHLNALGAVWDARLFTRPRLLSVLAAALYIGNDEVVPFLLERGANVNIPAGIEGHMSPLAAGISSGRLEWAKELILRGANPRDPVALWAAAHTDNFEAYNLLCSAVTAAKAGNIAQFARFAASEAIVRDNLAFLRNIIDHGIHLNAPLLPWEDARHWGFQIPSPNDPLACAVKKPNFDAVQLLLDHGADPNRAHLDDHGQDGHVPILSCLPYDWSSSVSCSIAKSLIAAGATVNYSGPLSLHAPLVSAVSNSSLPLIDLLIRNGGLVNSISSTRREITTPLCQAVINGDHEIVQKLLAEGASVFGSLLFEDVPRTAVQLAAETGYLDLLNLLLDNGKDGAQFILEYPLSIRLAYRNGNRAIARYLQSYRNRMYAHLGCATDEEILADVEKEVRDTKYWYRFWEDERYSQWKSLYYVLNNPVYFAFISKLTNEGRTSGDNTSLEEFDSGIDTGESASTGDDGSSQNDANSPKVSDAGNTIPYAENMDTRRESMDDLPDVDWQDFINFDVDKSDIMPNRGSCAADSLMEGPTEQTTTETTLQLAESDEHHHFTSIDGFDISQAFSGGPDGMNGLDGGFSSMPRESNRDVNALTELDLEFWPDLL